MTPISAGRRSSASAGTAGPTFSCRTAEISRSMYIAASTMATAPTTAQPQPTSKTPLRTRNSAAKAVEPGTASAITPVAIRIVASIGPPPRHPAQPGELAGRRAALDRSREEEERRRDQPVVDHLEQRARVAGGVRREDPDQDQVHLREARVRDHAAHIGRAEGEERGVDEPDRGEDEQRRAPVLGGAGVERDGDGQEAVRAGLRDHAGEDGGHLRRRLAVGVGQPAVEGEERRLDGERDREAEEDPGARSLARRAGSCRTCPRRAPPR